MYRQLLGIAALFACLLATAATSPFKVVHPRSYPLWHLSNGATTVKSTHLAAWTSKSGKEGVGVTVMAERCGTEAPAFKVIRAELRVEGATERFVGKPAKEVHPAPPQAVLKKKDKKGKKGKVEKKAKGPAEPPPPYFKRRFLYVPIPFDNEALWNDDLNKGKLVLELEVEGQPFSWTLDANQTRKGHHRAVGFGAGPPCPVTPSKCPKPEPASLPASMPATQPTSQPADTVLEKAPEGEVQR